MSETLSAMLFEIKYKNYIENPAKELIELFNKSKVLAFFDAKLFSKDNFKAYRQLEYRKDTNKYISIGVSSVVFGKTLQGNENFIKEKLLSILRDEYKLFKSVPWNSIPQKQIDTALEYLREKYPNHVKNIQKTEYLYIESEKQDYQYIYFPQLLRTEVKAEDMNDEIKKYQILKPDERYNILKNQWKQKIQPVLDEHHIKLIPLSESYFKIMPEPMFLFGKGQKGIKGLNNFYGLINKLKSYGFYRSNPVNNIIVLDVTGRGVANFHNLKKRFDEFTTTMNSFKLTYKLEFETLRYSESESLRRVDIESRIENKFIPYISQHHKFDKFAVLVVHSQKSKISELLYNSIKRVLLNNEINSQFVTIETVFDSKKFTNAYSNIILALFSKLKNIPYLLANDNRESPKIDYFVGYDVSREKNKNGHVMNFAGGIYFYHSNGEFKDVINFNVESEVIQEHEVSKLFPSKKLSGKRIIIHRDGNSKRNELNVLTEYFQANNIKAHIVYITKKISTRIFSKNNSVVTNPRKGVWFEYADNKAIAVTSNSNIGTKQPIRIEYYGAINDEVIPFERIVRDVFNFTYLYYGSVQEISVPVTIYNAHLISNFNRQGIEHNGESDSQYWL